MISSNYDPQDPNSPLLYHDINKLTQIDAKLQLKDNRPGSLNLHLTSAGPSTDLSRPMTPGRLRSVDKRGNDSDTDRKLRLALNAGNEGDF
jgi:hypothetical protein